MRLAGVWEPTREQVEGLKLLYKCLNPLNRPDDSREVMAWTFAQPEQDLGSYVRGPRLDWFAYMLAQKSIARLARLHNNCIAIYMRAEALTLD